MNEEEIIIILTAYLLANIPDIITQEEFDEVRQAIRALLDLYNKEKEKNKELYEIKYIASLFLNRPMKQFSIGEFRYKVNTFKENYISKDKIRNKIKEIEEYMDNTDERTMINEYECAIEFLEELLEEGE